jgi:hypothetical protein
MSFVRSVVFDQGFHGGPDVRDIGAVDEAFGAAHVGTLADKLGCGLRPA